MASFCILKCLYNYTGTLCTVLGKKYILCIVEDILVLVHIHETNYSCLVDNKKIQLPEFSKFSSSLFGLYSNNLKVKDIILSKSKDNLDDEQCIDNIYAMTNIVWLNDSPVLLELVDEGLELKFDAFYRKGVGYQAMLIWNGPKPKYLPILKNGEMILATKFFNLPVLSITFDKKQPSAFVLIEGSVRRIPFRHEVVNINGKNLNSLEELYKIYENKVDFSANVCKFITIHKNSYMYICSRIFMELDKSSTMCDDIYLYDTVYSVNTDGVDIITVKKTATLHFDIECYFSRKNNCYSKIVKFILNEEEVTLEIDKMSNDAVEDTSILYGTGFAHVHCKPDYDKETYEIFFCQMIETESPSATIPIDSKHDDDFKLLSFCSTVFETEKQLFKTLPNEPMELSSFHEENRKIPDNLDVSQDSIDLQSRTVEKIYDSNELLSSCILRNDKNCTAQSLFYPRLHDEENDKSAFSDFKPTSIEYISEKNEQLANNDIKSIIMMGSSKKLLASKFKKHNMSHSLTSFDADSIFTPFLIENFNLAEVPNLNNFSINQLFNLTRMLNSNLDTQYHFIRHVQGRLYYYRDLGKHFIVCKLFQRVKILPCENFSLCLFYFNKSYLHPFDVAAKDGKFIIFDATLINDRYTPVLVYDQMLEKVCIVRLNLTYYFNVKGIYKGCKSLSADNLQLEILVNDSALNISAAIMSSKGVLADLIEQQYLNVNDSIELHVIKFCSSSFIEPKWYVLFMHPFESSLTNSNKGSEVLHLDNPENGKENTAFYVLPNSKEIVVSNYPFMLRNYIGLVKKKTTDVVSFEYILPNGKLLSGCFVNSFSVYMSGNWVSANNLSVYSTFLFDAIRYEDKLEIIVVWLDPQSKPERQLSCSDVNYYSKPGIIDLDYEKSAFLNIKVLINSKIQHLVSGQNTKVFSSQGYILQTTTMLIKRSIPAFIYIQELKEEMLVPIVVLSSALENVEQFDLFSSLANDDGEVTNAQSILYTEFLQRTDEANFALSDPMAANIFKHSSPESVTPIVDINQLDRKYEDGGSLEKSILLEDVNSKDVLNRLDQIPTKEKNVTNVDNDKHIDNFFLNDTLNLDCPILEETCGKSRTNFDTLINPEVMDKNIHCLHIESSSLKQLLVKEQPVLPNIDEEMFQYNFVLPAYNLNKTNKITNDDHENNHYSTDVFSDELISTGQLNKEVTNDLNKSLISGSVVYEGINSILLTTSSYFIVLLKQDLSYKGLTPLTFTENQEIRCYTQKLSSPLQFSQIEIGYVALAAFLGNKKSVKQEVNYILQKNYSLFIDASNAFTKNLQIMLKADSKLIDYCKSKLQVKMESLEVGKQIINNTIPDSDSKTHTTTEFERIDLRYVTGIIVHIIGMEGVLNFNMKANSGQLCYFNQKVIYINKLCLASYPFETVNCMMNELIKTKCPIHGYVYKCQNLAIKDYNCIPYSATLLWTNKKPPHARHQFLISPLDVSSLDLESGGESLYINTAKSISKSYENLVKPVAEASSKISNGNCKSVNFEWEKELNVNVSSSLYYNSDISVKEKINEVFESHFALLQDNPSSLELNPTNILTISSTYSKNEDVNDKSRVLETDSCNEISYLSSEFSASSVVHLKKDIKIELQKQDGSMVKIKKNIALEDSNVKINGEGANEFNVGSSDIKIITSEQELITKRNKKKKKKKKKAKRVKTACDTKVEIKVQNDQSVTNVQAPNRPVSKRNFGIKKSILTGILKTVEETSGIVEAPDRTSYSFTREKFFLFGISLYKFSLKDIVKEGSVIEFEIDEFNSVAEAWIGDLQGTEERTYSSVLNWCRNHAILVSDKLKLIAEINWIPPECEPMMPTGCEIVTL